MSDEPHAPTVVVRKALEQLLPAPEATQAAHAALNALDEAGFHLLTDEEHAASVEAVSRIVLKHRRATAHCARMARKIKRLRDTIRLLREQGDTRATVIVEKLDRLTEADRADRAAQKAEYERRIANLEADLDMARSGGIDLMRVFAQPPRLVHVPRQNGRSALFEQVAREWAEASQAPAPTQEVEAEALGTWTSPEERDRVLSALEADLDALGKRASEPVERPKRRRWGIGTRRG